MAEHLRVTRASLKRTSAVSASAAMAEQRPRKKRAVLGDITNSSKLTAARQKRLVPVAKKAAVSEAETPSEDPQMCGPYASDIYEYLRKMEVETKRRPLSDYLDKVQKDVSANMRGVLVDWMVEVAEEYKLCSDTLFLSISYIDRFLSHNSVIRQKLQLVGVSSMVIASKYEEIKTPHVEDFCYITDNTFTKEEIVKMEADILKSLKFEMGNPTTKTFLRRLTDVAQQSYKTSHFASKLEFLSNCLAELSLLDYTCIKFLPSLVASSVVFLANFILRPNCPPWCSTLQQNSGYKPADLRECVLLIHDLYMGKRGKSLHAIREKYKQLKFKCVADLSSQEIPSYYFEDL